MLGDLMADEYLYTQTSRVSREAPVMILRFLDREVLLGGGANATHNIHTLGAKVYPVGIVGDDHMGKRLISIFADKGISTAGLVVHTGHPTTTKTRIMASRHHTTSQQVVRVDYEYTGNKKKDIEDELLDRLGKLLPEVDALLVSDYGYGVLSDRVIGRVNALSESGKLVVTVDSRYALLRYRHPTIISPNETEAQELLGKWVEDKRSVRLAAFQLRENTQSKAVLITRGRQGMALLDASDKMLYLPVYGGDEVADVTGAGDTVISVLTLALTSGAGFGEAARLANCAGGIVVAKSGTATTSQQELLGALKNLLP